MPPGRRVCSKMIIPAVVVTAEQAVPAKMTSQGTGSDSLLDSFAEQRTAECTVVTPPAVHIEPAACFVEWLAALDTARALPLYSISQYCSAEQGERQAVSIY